MLKIKVTKFQPPTPEVSKLYLKTSRGAPSPVLNMVNSCFCTEFALKIHIRLRKTAVTLPSCVQIY